MEGSSEGMIDMHYVQYIVDEAIADFFGYLYSKGVKR